TLFPYTTLFRSLICEFLRTMIMTRGSHAPSPEEVLCYGEIELLGQLANSSNETFLFEVTYCDELCWAIYKPDLGERPLRDFEPGLYRQERVVFLLSETRGWLIVPTTVVGDNEPFVNGSLKLFIDRDQAEHFFTLMGQNTEYHDQVRRLALFGLESNNADRKVGHVLH